MSEFAMSLLYNNMCPVHEQELYKIGINNHVCLAIKNNIIPELHKLNIVTYMVPTPLTKYGNYWPDYDSDYIQTHCTKKLHNLQYMYFIVYLDTRESTYRININKPIKINFKPINVETKIKVIQIFNTYLNNYYVWSGSNETPMYLLYEAKKLNPIDITSLKEDDAYPYLSISIGFNKNLFEHNNIVQNVVNYVKTHIYQNGVFKQDVCMHTIDITINGNWNIKNAQNILENNNIIALKIIHGLNMQQCNTIINFKKLLH